MEKLTIIIPAYNEEKNIERAARVVLEEMKGLPLMTTILFVDDGSRDNTFAEIERMKGELGTVQGIRFSRNFGKEAALFAGLKEAEGDYVAVMDCDLQHPPKVLKEMTEILIHNPDLDVVEGRKRSRGKESAFHKLFAKLFYGMINGSSGLDLSGATDFKVMRRPVVEALNEMPERLTFFRALSAWVGFKTESVLFDVEERQEGTTKWSYKKLFKYALLSISSFSNVPMQIVTLCGVLFFIFAVVLGAETLWNFAFGHAVEGFTTVILLLLIMGSIIMFSLGVLGYYLAKIYEEIKMRPRYIVSKRVK